MILTLDSSGNLRPVAANHRGVKWVEKDGLIWAEQSERVLHFYPDVMVSLGVSRICVGWQNDIPKTADVISLTPASSNDTLMP